MVIFTIPLLPRPTITAAPRLLAPTMAVFVVGLTAMHWSAHRRVNRNRRVSYLPAALLAATTIYAARVGFTTPNSEGGFLFSRFLMAFFVVCIFYLFSYYPVEVVWRRFAYGCLPLAGLVIIIGLTGIDFLEVARPARTLGVTLPWYKTAGVPRSFGEQGILVAIAGSFLLGYWHTLRRPIARMLAGALIAIIMIGQSRNMYLSALTVMIVWFLAGKSGRRGIITLVLWSAGLATFVIGLLLPLIAASDVGTALIGQGIYRENVLIRFVLIDNVIDLIQAEPWRTFIGFNHTDWADYYSTRTGSETGVHNNIAASILFLGFIGGGVSLFLFFFLPAKRLLAQVSDPRLSDDERLRRRVALTALAGTLVCLNFYEGFFSLALALQVGLMWALAEGRDFGASASRPEPQDQDTAGRWSEQPIGRPNARAHR